MAECEICGESAFTNRCNECGLVVCGDHILPENHNCDALLAEKASAEWFKEGDREQVLGESADDEQPTEDVAESSPVDGEYTVADANPDLDRNDDARDETSSTDGDDTIDEIDAGGDKSGRTGGEGRTREPSTASTDTGSGTLESQPLSKRDWTVKQANQSRLQGMVPSGIRRAVSGLVSSILQFFVGVVRLCGVGAVWGGSGLAGWRYLTGASLGTVGSALGVVIVGIVVVYVTTQ